VISCRGLTKRFGNFTAVDGVSFEVPRGAICACLGANGAGKSTTVKMLTGLLRPTSGEAEVCGVKVGADPVELRRRIGVLPEDLGLFDDLSVEEHLRLTGEVYGLAGEVARERTEQLIAALRLEPARHTFAGRCSHGTRKKTSLAMALLPNPQALFLDEPFEAIDPVTSKTMRDLLLAAARRGTTVFLTSHILPVAQEIATQFVIIHGGKVALSCGAAELPGSLERVYFELAEAAEDVELNWLGAE
jgi:ABC-2 type transport system ATP-binding protein